VVAIALVPFVERALRHFINLERPEGMGAGRRGPVRGRPARPALTAADTWLGRRAPAMQTVGHLYRGIEAAWRALCARYG